MGRVHMARREGARVAASPHMLRDLAAGTVTFLFTDIEGSTKLLHEATAGQPVVIGPRQTRTGRSQPVRMLLVVDPRASRVRSEPWPGQNHVPTCFSRLDEEPFDLRAP